MKKDVDDMFSLFLCRPKIRSQRKIKYPINQSSIKNIIKDLISSVSVEDYQEIWLSIIQDQHCIIASNKTGHKAGPANCLP